MPIDRELNALLAGVRTIDLTTTGRRSGQPSRIEIWWFHFEDRFIVTGTPGRRHWMANIGAEPSVIVHAAGVDQPGRATVVGDREFRRRFFTTKDPEVSWYSSQAELSDLIENAPMIEVLFD